MCSGVILIYSHADARCSCTDTYACMYTNLSFGCIIMNCRKHLAQCYEPIDRQMYMLTAFHTSFLLQMIYILTLLQQYLQAQVTTMQTVSPDTQKELYYHSCFTEHSDNICRGGCVSEHCECSCSSCVSLRDELGCLVSDHCLLTVVRWLLCFYICATINW